MKKFDLHLFDLDDTLINTASSYLFAYQEILQETSDFRKKRTLSLKEIDFFCRIFGSGNPGLVFSTIFRFYGWKCKWTTATLVEKFWNKFWNKLQVFPEATTYLNLLQKNKKKLAIVSNGESAKQEQKIKQLGLEKFFPLNNFFISSDFKKSQAKPAPFMLDFAMKKNNASQLQTIFYGNNNSDILSGKLAKIAVISLIIEPPLPKNLMLFADYCFTSWKQLIQKFSM